MYPVQDMWLTNRGVIQLAQILSAYQVVQTQVSLQVSTIYFYQVISTNLCLLED
jgi:hypothetical protein